MLKIFYSTFLKPYLLSLFLSREQTQMQWQKDFIVFEQCSGWWGFSGFEVLLQLMIFSRGTVIWSTPNYTETSHILENCCGSLDCWGQVILSPTQPDVDDYHLLCRWWTSIYTFSLPKVETKYICSKLASITVITVNHLRIKWSISFVLCSIKNL